MILGGLVIAAVALPSSALAQGPTYPYDGHSPFNCQLQDVGTGTAFTQPKADPFCVEFDKTQQNVTDFGIFDFLSKEPARVAAAAPKCFYFQRDHWTGSIVQGAQPELWHWDGSYFFDKASGSGGANLANFRIGGQPMDGTPYAPAEFQPYLTPGGGGGAYVSGEVQADPSCAAMVNTPSKWAQVYYHTMPGGPMSRQAIGPFTLREPRGALHHTEGPAHEVVDGTDRFNVTGGGQLRLAYSDTAGGHPSDAPSNDSALVAAILTTSPAHTIAGVHPDVAGDEARRALGAGFDFSLGSLQVFEAPRRRHSRLFLGIGAGTLQWLAIVDPRQIDSKRVLKSALGTLSLPGKGRVDSTGMPW